MRYFTFIQLVALVLLISCQESHNKTINTLNVSKKVLESDTGAIVGLEEGIYQANSSKYPVSILKSVIATNQFGSKYIKIKIINKSKKIVDGVKIAWRLSNNFGEEDLRYNLSGDNQDIIQKELQPGQITIYSKNIDSSNDTNVSAYVYEIHFKDGSKWDSHNL